MLENYFQQAVEAVVGRITDVRLEEREFGARIVVEVAPVGESGLRIFFFTPSTHRRSKWQRWLGAMRKLGKVVNSPQDLIGTIVRFELAEEVYNIDGTEQIAEFWMPKRIYSSEAEALADIGATESAPKAEITPEVIALAKTLYQSVNRDANAFKIVAAQSWPNIPSEQLLKLVA